MKKLLKMLKKDERGLTLVELLAVIVILAIVGAIAFVAIGNVIENSRQDAHISNALQVISAAELYEASGNSISDGMEASTIENVGDLIDPWDSDNEDYDFTVSKSGNDITVVPKGVTQGKCPGFTESVTKQQLNSKGRDLCKN